MKALRQYQLARRRTYKQSDPVNVIFG